MPSNPSSLSPPGEEEIETTFRRLRREGHSRREALRRILDVLEISLSEAKTLLLTNDTWHDVQTATGARPEAKERSGVSSGTDGRDGSVPPAPG